MTVTYAQTLDGRLATASGSSRWISSPDSLVFAHGLRSEHDAIMVGVGTVLRDDPRLTVRLVEGRDPVRIIVDSTLRTPDTAAVLANGAATGTILAVTEGAPVSRCAEVEALGARVLRMPAGSDGRVNLRALVASLGETGIGSVMVEGGANLITSLLKNRLVDRLAVCIAPKILGKGIEAVGDLGIDDLALSLALQEVRVTRYGPDLVIDGRVTYPENGDRWSQDG